MNKSANFSCLDMGTRPLFRVFQANPCEIIRDSKERNTKQIPLKYKERNGRSNDFKIASF